MELNLYDALVVSIDDKDKKGKIQIQILPEQKDVKKADLPWAIPFSSINSISILSLDLPEQNSMIRVLVDKYWRRFYYLSNRFFTELFDFSKIDSILGEVDEIANKDYKNLTFRLYLDGGLDFHNNNDGSHGFIHKSGAYSMFDKDGKIYSVKGDTRVALEDKLIVEASEILYNDNKITASSTSLKINDNLEVMK